MIYKEGPASDFDFWMIVLHAIVTIVFGVSLFFWMIF